MRYFFVLGNNPTLSIAEISAVFSFSNAIISESGNVLIADFENEFDATRAIKRLGGTIKIGVVSNEIEFNKEKEILEKAKKLIKPIEGKYKFGISYYGKSKLYTKRIAMEIKKYLREKKISCRWVTSKEKVLSSVVVEQNKLNSKGLELVLIDNKNKILIGKTLAVQPFKELSFRDYGRPARDDKSGMLPPKLAQIMINLANVRTQDFASPQDIILLDPFCGSGTVLTEAMLMGFKNLIGCDSSEKAVKDTKENIEWTVKNYELRITNYELFKCSVLDLLKKIQKNSVDVIVTEPYLGPQRGRIEIKKVIKELEELYSKALVEYRKVLKKDGRVVMIWPVFKDTRNKTQDTKKINPKLGSFKIINSIPESLRGDRYIKTTKRNTIVYGREGQRVWREIVVLEKNDL